MINKISSDLIIFVFISFFIFSYLIKYISILLNNFYSISNKKLQYELYESGGPIYYKHLRHLDIQSYLLALFFLIFELEFFITYPCIIYSMNFSSDLIINNYNNFYLQEISQILDNNNIINERQFFLYFQQFLYNLRFGIFPVFFIFFLSIIFALALEWVYGGLEFLKEKFGRKKINKNQNFYV